MKCNPKTFIHSFFAKKMSRHNALARSGAVDSFHDIVNIKGEIYIGNKMRRVCAIIVSVRCRIQHSKQNRPTSGNDKNFIITRTWLYVMECNLWR